MKKECLKVAQHALLESNWVQTGNKNALVKIKEQLEKTNKTNTRKGKKNKLVEIQNEHHVEKANQLMDELIIEVEEEAKQSQIMSQLNSSIIEELEKDPLQTNGIILKDEADSKFFKEVFIKCKQALTYKYQDSIQIGKGTDMTRPMYQNQFTNEFYDVENLALRFYALHQGMNGMHSENSFGISIFGLLMWDQIFYDKIPYVFQTPYQAFPLDFGTKDFYKQREDIIDERLRNIEMMCQQELEMEIETSYDKNKHKYNQLVNWDSLQFNKRRLKELGGILGGKRMKALLSNYCKEFKFWNHGMPDLVLWNSNSKTIKFSEVKSENDRLSEVQKSWLAFLSQNEIQVEVCYVNRTQDDHREAVAQNGQIDDKIEVIEVFTESLH